MCLCTCVLCLMEMAWILNVVLISIFLWDQRLASLDNNNSNTKNNSKNFLVYLCCSILRRTQSLAKFT